MKLTRKTDIKPPEKKAEPIDWKIYEVDDTALIPYGKWAQSTLQEVKEQDSNYYKWILTNDMIESWGLYKIKGHTKKKSKQPQWSPFTSSTGEVWLGLREAPGNGVEYKY